MCSVAAFSNPATVGEVSSGEPSSVTGAVVTTPWKHVGVEIGLTILAIVTTVLMVTALAERIRFSAPLLLMLVGIGISFVPFIDEPRLTPELILLGFLPPLLYAAAIRKPTLTSAAETAPPIAAIATRRQVIAVASLTSDSPSRMVTS